MNDNEKKFEDIISELESLVAEVETGTLPMEKMIEQIERGAKLIKQCQKRLDVMNSKVEILFKDDGNSGEFAEFDPATERSTAAKKAPAPTAAPEQSPQEELPF